MRLENLTEAGREELALALLLWKDFKANGTFDLEITKQALMFAKLLEVETQFTALLSKLPPMRIEPR